MIHAKIKFFNWREIGNLLQFKKLNFVILNEIFAPKQIEVEIDWTYVQARMVFVHNPDEIKKYFIQKKGCNFIELQL